MRCIVKILLINLLFKENELIIELQLERGIEINIYLLLDWIIKGKPVSFDPDLSRFWIVTAKPVRKAALVSIINYLFLRIT